MTVAVEESNRWMLRARDAMDRTYAQPLDIAVLARVAQVSEAHFIRTFRVTFGETPHRYLQRRWVERAMFLLRRDRPECDGDLRTRSALQPGTFSRTFREIVGETPTEYRRSSGQVAAPTCFTMAWTRPSSFGEAPAVRSLRSIGSMLNSIRISHVFVLDQDQALDFYVGKLGLEVRNDLDLGFMRWLTVRVPGQPDREILLERPGPPAMDEAAADQVRELITKGASGFAVGFTTTDVKTTTRHSWQGVDITQEPVEQSYGTDIGIRDPFGNHIRIVQLPTERAG